MTHFERKLSKLAQIKNIAQNASQTQAHSEIDTQRIHVLTIYTQPIKCTRQYIQQPDLDIEDLHTAISTW